MSRTRRTKRPVDKDMVTVAQTATTTQQSTLLRQSTVSETYTGGHVSGSVIVTGTQQYGFAMIIMLQQGNTAGSIDTTDGNATYRPERDVVWAVGWRGDQSNLVKHFDQEIKTMRKMHSGDTMYFISKASGSSSNITALVTSFYKQ